MKLAFYHIRRDSFRLSNRKMLLALLVIGLIAAVSIGVQYQAVANSAQNNSALAFHDAMRQLWEEHITWTRLAIVSFTFSNPDFSATATRLLQNQVDIGNAVRPFYGDKAADRLTSLLTTHILLAVQILKNFKAGNQTGLAQSIAAWYANANQIAEFLHDLNPNHLPLALIQSEMKMHLDLTLKEAVDELSGNYQGSVAEYNQVELEILGMADILSSSIIAQFPHMFTGSLA